MGHPWETGVYQPYQPTPRGTRQPPAPVRRVGAWARMGAAHARRCAQSCPRCVCIYAYLVVDGPERPAFCNSTCTCRCLRIKTWMLRDVPADPRDDKCMKERDVCLWRGDGQLTDWVCARRRDPPSPCSFTPTHPSLHCSRFLHSSLPPSSHTVFTTSQ